MTATITLIQGIGYTGRRGQKAYAARILGTSDRYGLTRDFLAADKVERDSFTAAKYMRTYTYDVGPGLYEVSEGGTRAYRIVWINGDQAVTTTVDADRAEAIARRMTAGDDYETARRATEVPVAEAQPAAEREGDLTLADDLRPGMTILHLSEWLTIAAIHPDPTSDHVAHIEFEGRPEPWQHQRLTLGLDKRRVRR